MTSETIQKYSKYSTPKLKLKAQTVFNAWIRKRDEGQPCINCGKYRTLQAGHYFAAGKYGSVRFNEDNVHGECVSCNYFNSQSHAQGYRTNLIAKIGVNSFERLEKIAMYHRTTKDDRFYFIEIIEKYKK
jgi:5-methylcytosine-specific restriction endonuclease McrA